MFWWVKDVGMDFCVGVIFGMGEMLVDWVDVVFEFQKIGVELFLVNVFNFVFGMLFGDVDYVDIMMMEFVKIVVVY